MVRLNAVQALADFEWQRKSNHSFVVNVLANALYSLFAAEDGVSLGVPLVSKFVP